MKNLTLIIAIICTQLINLSAQITPNFEASDTEGCGSISVTFINSSTPSGGLTYNWDFGNGYTSTLKDPTIAYILPGKYTVKLVISDGVNKDSIIKNDFIIVHPNPEVNIGITESEEGCAPYSLNFIDNSTLGDGAITNWDWDFGDGTLGYTQNISHTYLFENNYEVSLVVIDEYNCRGVGTFNKLISIYKPVANFIADPTSSCVQPMNTHFYNNSTDGYGNLSYKWDFGDGETDTIENPTHQYFDGNYSVKLIVKDDKQCSDTIIKNNLINLSGVQASFTLNKDTFCVDEEIIITNTTENAYSYKWDFGDGEISNHKTPTHSYSETGNYNITLISDHLLGCSDTTSYTVNIEGVSADFIFSENYACATPAIIQCTNKSTNATSFEWSFGNGQSSIEENPTVVYNEEGVYSNTLTVTSAHGCVAAKTIDSCMTVKYPKAYFTPNFWIDPYQIKGCAPLTVNFKNKSNYDNKFDHISQYLWDFGDGGHSTESEPTHIYGQVGKYDVTFQFITEKGCVSSVNGTRAMVGTPQHTDFYKILPDTICASQEVQFFDDSQDSTLINDWLWLFGDSTYAKVKNPKHTFIDTGYMNVLLQSYYNGCPSVEVKDKFIYVKGPIINIEDNIECSEPYKVNLNSNAIDAEKVYWTFGDGSPTDSININTSHTYSDNKVYNVFAIAKNSDKGCSYTSSKEFVIKDIKANFSIDKQIGCENLMVNLNSENCQDQYYFHSDAGYGQYLWDFGDGEKLMTNEVNVSHIYKNKGNYKLKLTVNDFRGCSDTLVSNVKIYKPDVDFSALDFEGCMPMKVNFDNVTESDTTIVAWEWNFGDDSTSVFENPVHTYNNFGIYDVSLTATDKLGCVSTNYRHNFIKALRPIPNFIVNDNTICDADIVHFFPADTSNIVSYKWTFGDGEISEEAFPTHLYDSIGHYSISLSLIDSRGCDSTKIINDYIYIQKYPVAKFNADEISSQCYPFHINFNDTTNNPEVVDWFWDFGDGESSSHLKSPMHIYTKPGKYNVSLNLVTGNGCSNSISKNNYIDIKGPYATINSPDTVCKNSDALFIVENKKDIFEMQWIFGDGSLSLQDTVYHKFTNSGYAYPILFLTSDNHGTCDIFIKDSVFIPNLNSEIKIANFDTSGCVPFDINIKNDCNNATKWFWDFGDGNYSNLSYNNHTFISPNEYNIKLIVENDFGCKDSSQIKVEAFPLPKVKTIIDTLICYGTDIKLFAEGAKTYKWFPETYLDNEDVNFPISKPDSSIKYVVFGTDENGCTNSSDLQINVQQEPNVNFKDTSIIIGEQVILNAYSDDILTYDWFPSYNLTCTNCPQTIASPLEPTTYELTVTDINKCFTKTFDVNIDIIKEYTIDVPTAFTPNGDGINDKIFVRGWGVEDLILFRIFNRYGEIVFETTDKNIGWDGTYKGKMQATETFTYIASIKTYDNRILSKRGTIKLLK